MKFKKAAGIGLALAMAVSLAGCGGSSSSTSSSSSGSSAASSTTAETSADTSAAASTSSDSAAEDTSTQSSTGVIAANTDPANTEKTDKTLTIGLMSEPSALWMGGSGKSENEMAMIDAAIMDGLVRVDRKTNEVIPALATSWEWTDDTHCKFTLRDGVTMTDGTPLVADDVVYSAGVWKDKSANSDTGRFIVGATADDDKTVTIEFNVTAPDMLYMLGWGNFGIVSEDEVNAAGGIDAANNNPVMGCGRYKFKEWNRGQSIVLERNDNYWDPDYAGYYQTIRLTFTNDAASRVMAVQAGDAQVAYQIPLSQAATYEGDSSVQVAMYTYGQNGRVWYNMGPNAGATADIKVRQAIDKALDFNAIAQVGTAGGGSPVLGYFPENSKFYNETFTTEERAVDIDGAKQLLEEAGYSDGLDLTAVTTSDEEAVFTVMQENLRAANINLTINVLDTPAFVEAANGGNYDLVHVGDLVDARYPAIMAQFFQSNIDTFCIGGSKSTTPEIEAAINEFISETDEAKAKEEGAALEQTWKDSLYFSNTYGLMNASVIAPNLKGLSTLERGFIDFTTFYEAQ